MKKISGLFALMAVVFGTASAHAQVPPCTLDFEASGAVFRLIIGPAQFDGTGTLTCGKDEYPVNIRLGGNILGLGAGLGWFRIKGVATGIGIAENPKALLGNYVSTGGLIAIGAGAGVQVPLRATEKALTLNVAMNIASGFGFNVGVDTLEIY